jgi:hypothetical protein
MVGVIIGVVMAVGGDDKAKKPDDSSNTVALTPTRSEPTPTEKAPGPTTPPAPVAASAPTPAPDVTPTAANPDVATDVPALFEAGNYSEVVAQCNASREAVARNASTCTLAACKQKEFSKAKRWFTSVASALRASVIKDCGGVLRPPAAAPVDEKEKCRRNPMLCQH